MKKRANILTNLVIALLLTAGLALVLYPTVANRINEAKNGGVIEGYRDAVKAAGEDAAGAMLEAAAAYNAELARSTPYIGRLTAARRAQYESLLDPSGTGVMGYLEIPKADVYLAIYHGTDENVLQTGVGHLEASSLPVPGESTHTVLTGHSGLPSARLFTDLDQLRPGDRFTLHVLNETYTYRVTGLKRVLPEELESMRIEPGKELCTLVTCTPYGVNTHRLAVTGERIETPETAESGSRGSARALKSGWNRRYRWIPAALFAVIVAAVPVARRLFKKRKRRTRAVEEATRQ